MKKMLTIILLIIMCAIAVTLIYAGAEEAPAEPNLDEWEPIIISAPETVIKEPRKWLGITEGDVIEGTLTFYDVCIACCGKEDGITASGIEIKNGVEPETAVCGCNWLPLRSKITIDGVPYIVADRGNSDLDKVGRIDVFNPAGHEDCRQRGIVYGAMIEIIELAIVPMM